MDEEHGYVAGFAVTDHVVVAVGGLSSQRPTVLASSDATHFADRTTPRRRGLRDALAVGDAIWVCGEYGQLAVSRDHGATWTVLDTGTESCLFALALATDGAIWVVGEHGYAARVLGDRPHRVDLGADDALLAAYAVRTAAAAARGRPPRDHAAVGHRAQAQELLRGPRRGVGRRDDRDRANARAGRARQAAGRAPAAARVTPFVACSAGAAGGWQTPAFRDAPERPVKTQAAG